MSFASIIEHPDFQPTLWWILFSAFVVVMLALDLGVFHRRPHEIKFKEALGWSVLWIGLGLLFNLGILFDYVGSYSGQTKEAALDFLTAWLMEKSLSVDNVFVFAMIFTYFAVPAAYQHRVLFYGIIGALILRAIFIFGGIWLVHRFAWMFYVFGGFLIITGVKMALSRNRQTRLEDNLAIRVTRHRWVRRVLPITKDYGEGRFVLHRKGRRPRWVATPLLLVLISVEVTDVMFAVDSIPAVIAITTDQFIVFTSNIFAILGLRALYFVLANFIKMFRYLSYGLAVLLVFIGGKMLAHAALDYKLPTAVSLLVIAVILTVAVVASVLASNRHAADDAQPQDTPQA